MLVVSGACERLGVNSGNENEWRNYDMTVKNGSYKVFFCKYIINMTLILSLVTHY